MVKDMSEMRGKVVTSSRPVAAEREYEMGKGPKGRRVGYAG